MDEAYIGSIVLFAGNFEPRNWMYCNGQVLSIMDYQALYSILGTVYGGDGRNTFALPDLRGRVPLHAGTGQNLTPRMLGEKSGQEIVTLDEIQIPSHTHQATTKLNAKEEANAEEPTNNFIAGIGDTTFGSATDTQMNTNAVEVAIGNTGGNQPHNNMQPYLGLHYIICVAGIYPPRH